MTSHSIGQHKILSEAALSQELLARRMADHRVFMSDRRVFEEFDHMPIVGSSPGYLLLFLSRLGEYLWRN
jgi:hypothetical protein